MLYKSYINVCFHIVFYSCDFIPSLIMARFSLLLTFVIITSYSYSFALIPHFPLSLDKLKFFNAIVRFTEAQKGLHHLDHNVTTSTMPYTSPLDRRVRRSAKPDVVTFTTIPPKMHTYPSNHRDTLILMHPSPNAIIEFTNRAAVHTSRATYHDRCIDLSKITNGLVFKRCVEYLLFFEQDVLDPLFLQQVRNIQVPTPEERKKNAAAHV